MEPQFFHDATPATVLSLLLPLVPVILAYALRQHDLDHIPTIGYSGPFLSWVSAVRYFFDARSILAEGYALYPQGTFKMATFYGWTVVLNGKQYIDDIARSNPSKLSSITALVNMFQLNASFGDDVIDRHHHVANVIRTSVTRNLDSRFYDNHQEVIQSFGDGIPCIGEDWVPITAYSLAVEVICRVTSQFFFEKPLCNDPKFRAVCEQATMELFKASFVRPFPKSLKPLLARFTTRVYNLRYQMEQYLGPIIEERARQEILYSSDTQDKPNDLITWLIEGGISAQKPVTVDDISSRVLIISFTAIHTTSAVFTSLLYQLCLNSQDAEVLREEVEATVKEEGWTRQAIAKMHKLDSYLRESQRLNTVSDLAVSKVVLEKYTFSDGLIVPKGVSVSINVFARHRAADQYTDPDVFDGFRHVREEGEGQLLATSPTVEYHAFGHGKSACPGRFLAIMEVKLMLAHLLTYYDFRLEKDEYPTKLLLDANALPNHKARVLFRKRNTS